MISTHKSISLPDRLLAFLLPAVFLLFPLLPALGGYGRISAWARSLFLLLVVLFAGTALLLPPELALTGSGRLTALWRPLIRRSPVRLLLLLYLLWSLLSALCSENPGVWQGLGRQEGMVTLLCYALLFWVSSSYGRWPERLLDLLGLAILFNAGLGLLQYAGLNPLGLFPEGADYHDAFLLYNGAFLGTLGNIDILSAFLCLTLPLFYASVCRDGPRRHLFPLAAGVLLLTVADVASGALSVGITLALTFPLFFCASEHRSAVLTALSAVLLAAGVGRLLYADRNTPLTLRPGPLSVLLLILGCLLLTARTISPKCQLPHQTSPRRSFFLLLGAVLLLGCISLAAVWALPIRSGTLGELHQILHGNLEPEFGSGRIRIWQEVLSLIAERPLLGGGPDTLAARMTFTFSRYIEAVGRVVDVRIDTAHNDLLNIAVNQGLPALAFYLAALIVWFRESLRRLADVPSLWLLLPAMLAYLLQSCFTFSICSVSPLFWILLGVGERLIYASDLSPEKRSTPMSTTHDLKDMGL